jgi:CHAT domain-containing protein/Tfp pilus assembly protein PilF
MTMIRAFAILLLVGAPASGAAAPSSVSGVIVESVRPGGPAAAAGLRAGDLLVSWRRVENPPANPSGASGTFRTPFDVSETNIDQSPRARRLTIEYRRGGETGSVSIQPYRWEVETRPRFSGSREESYEAGRRLFEGDKTEEGIRIWTRLANDLSGSDDHLEAAWVWSRIARKQAESEQIDPAVRSFGLAIEQARLARRVDVQSQLWASQGKALANARRYGEAKTALQKALSLREQERPDSLAVANCLEDLIQVSEPRGAAYEAAQTRALRIREKVAPGSSVHAESLQDIAFSSYFRGDLRRAVELQQQALAIHRQIDEAGSRVAYAINNLCGMEVTRGNLAVGEQLCEESLALSRGFEGEVGLTLGSGSLINLGEIALQRGDFERAKQLQLRALDLREQSAGSEGIGWNLSELGTVALRRGDYAEAEEYFRRAQKLLAAERRPNSGYEAAFKKQLAECAYGRGDLVGARALLREAASALGSLDPEGAQAAGIRDDLGQVLTGLGEYTEAEQQLRQARGMRRRHSPTSVETAESSHNLGLLLWKTGRLAEAEAELRRSIEDLEAQEAKLGGSEEDRSLFASEFADYYRDYLRLLIELKREEDAFLLLERFRAASFLRTLAQRDLGAPGEVPPDLERRRRAANAEYERTQQELAQLQPGTQATEIEAGLARLSDLRREKAEIAGEIRKASPRYGALRYPRALDLAAARGALDPGTLLLSYAVGRGRTYLFAIEASARGGSALSVFMLPATEQALRESVDAFRRLIARSDADADLATRSRALYSLLLQPAQTLIERSERLLILPDGPLHKLPWSALSRVLPGRKPSYLAEWKPIHTAVSATVYAELRRRRDSSPREGAVVVAAFGDPTYPPPPPTRLTTLRGEPDEPEEVRPSEDEVAEPGDAQLRSVARGGFRFEPLPKSRIEVTEIAALYSPKTAVYLGRDATEERAKTVSRDVPLIHFACHAVTNNRFPLDSALVLTIPKESRPGQDNGLLQAWEVFESVRIDADLVTLSACESGLGKEMAGEGLIGLTRAFQYAGARSVLASLWKVDDKATAELMTRFYGYLKAGKTKDEALRLAEIDLIRSAEFSQPKHWAAFQLSGDWK